MLVGSRHHRQENAVKNHMRFASHGCAVERIVFAFADLGEYGQFAATVGHRNGQTRQQYLGLGR